MAAPLVVLLACAGTRLVFSVVSARYFVPRSGITAGLGALMVFAPASCALEALLIWRGAVTPASAAAGGALYAAALGLFAWTLRAHGARRPSPIFSRDPPAWLVTRGPYRLVRHPFYAAYLLASAGSLVAAGGPGLALLSAANALVYLAAARREERAFAAGPLRARYAAYRARTGMLLPRLRPGGAQKSSWASAKRPE